MRTRQEKKFLMLNSVRGRSPEYKGTLIGAEYTKLYFEVYPSQESYYYICTDSALIHILDFDPPSGWNLYNKPKTSNEEKIRQMIEVTKSDLFLTWYPMITDGEEFFDKKTVKAFIRKEKLKKINESSNFKR